MEIKESEIKKIKIIDPGEDAITVYYEEKHAPREYDPNYWQGRVTIFSDFGFSVNYFWGAMGQPLKEFFCQASTCYLVDKFLQEASEKCDSKMLERVIEKVKAAFRKQLKDKENGISSSKENN